MPEISHYDLVLVLAFIAGGLMVGFGVLGKFARDIHRGRREMQRLAGEVEALLEERASGQV